MSRTPASRSAPLVLLRRLALAVAAIAVAGGVVAIAPRADAVTRQAAAPSSRWEERLARLDPLRPLDYLELAEEVADAAQDDDERELARQLCGLAGALDTERFGRSAMLAIAALASPISARVRPACTSIPRPPAAGQAASAVAIVRA